MADRKTEKPHAIFIPFPLQGHLIPSVLLAVKLASRGFTITFINTESIHHSITKSSSESAANCSYHDGDVFAEARKSGLDIRYATVSDGLPLVFDRSLNHDQYMECLFHVFSAHVDEIVGNLVKCDASINCLIADSFHVWPVMISKKYKLVNISFWTEPALVLNLYYHMDLLKKNGHYDSLDKHEDVIDYIPGVESIKPSDLIYAHTSKHDLTEIAYGLLQSRVSFVWALRPDIVSSNDTNALPLGFEDQEVTKKIKGLMREDKSSELRKEITMVKTTLQDALAVGGSSQRNFDRFISEVKVKTNKMK
ncbi:hypothetical protein L2E82_32635 [Cichorium intybus]|uniref:Uncharacterized protein n=1 Tax=Cichorium intybus TaxID=13427 RepID=A0ACB9BGF0_CICIN|nr:hypothetical protein L2E82_32635 [Cichorium intybus]